MKATKPHCWHSPRWQATGSNRRRARHGRICNRASITDKLKEVLDRCVATKRNNKLKRPTYYLKLRHQRLSRYAASRIKRCKCRKIYQPFLYVRPGSTINAPVKFDLTNGVGVKVVKFLRAVAVRVLRLKEPVRLNFKKTESLHVPGAILLYAELDRIIRLSDLPKPITVVDPMLRRPREVLKQIGIYQLVGDSSDVVPTREDVVFWKTTKGASQSGDNLGPILEFVAERANRDHVKQVELSGIWRGVSEAVVNTIDHAYSKPREDGFAGLIDTKWWMFTQIRNQRFTAAVCDLGCGYRATVNLTIPETFISKWNSILIGNNQDAMAIQTAMEYGRSGTQLNNRGKGSRDALSVLKKHGTGELFVLSNTGWVGYKYVNGVEVLTESDDIGINIRGTIIWWNLPLKDG